MNMLSLNDILESISDFVNECLGPLGNDGTDSVKMIGYARDFIIQLISTIIIFLLVKKFLWKPITEMLEKRSKALDEERDAAKAASENAKALEEDLRAKLADASNEVKTIIASAEMDANARRDEIIAEAKAEAKRRLEAAKQEIELERKNKQNEIQTMIVDTAFQAASKILEREVDQKKYLRLVNEIIEGATQND